MTEPAPVRFGRDLVGWLDRGVGAALEQSVRRHHRRRLDRLGHASVLEPTPEATLWADTGWRPPSSGNEVEVLVDGGRALSAIAAAVRSARSHVHVAGWHLTPDFRLEEGSTTTVRDLLADAAERVDVRVLLWAGPPLPVFQPTRRNVVAVRDQLTRGTRIDCALDARERTMHCHHEKIVVIDDDIAFVGGIDLTSLAGNRLDTRQHPARNRLGWHDVAARLRGPVVADVAEHFAQRWREVAHRPLPRPHRPDPAGDVEAQIVRTVPEGTYRFAPRGEFGVLETYTRALRSARSLIYIENQFLWSAEVVGILSEKLRNPPSMDFRIVLLLPTRPNNGADTTRGQLGCLLEADGGRGRLLPVTIHCHDPGASEQPLYVHAKVAIVDDRWLTIGSANLNEHSLFNDTEMNVVSCDPALARRTRLELWSEHLARPVADVDGDVADVVDRLWKPIAEEQLRLRLAGRPLTHRLMRLPAVSHRSKRLIGPLRGLLVDA